MSTAPMQPESSKPTKQLAMIRFLKVLMFLDQHGPVQSLNNSNTENVSDVRLLYQEGLISGTEMNAAAGYQLLHAAITPKGAVAVYEWEAVIQQRSSIAKLWKAITIISSVLGTIAVELVVLYAAKYFKLGN